MDQRFDLSPGADDARLARYHANSKSVVLAYLAWFFLGAFGVHRMYLGRWISGFLLLALTVVGGSLAWILVGYLLLIPAAVWWFLDFFLTYMMVESHNRDAAARLR